MATQNVTDPRLGQIGLTLLARGADTAATMAAIERAAGDHAPWRQVTAINASGHGAFSGANALGRNGHRFGPDAVAAGNMLGSDDVLPAMVSAFAADPTAELGERLMIALEAALAAGGEAGPVHSAGLVVVAEQPWPLADLRVDWADAAPIAQLRALWDLYRPQMHDYVTRALNPQAAPSYGVPGDP